MPVDVKALRELAEKATPGPWADEISEIAASDQVMTVVGLERRGPPYMEYDALVLSDNDRAFIAAANPSTVLALLDEIERKDKAAQEVVDAADHLLTMLEGESEPEWRVDAMNALLAASRKVRAALSPATPTPETNDASE